MKLRAGAERLPDQSSTSSSRSRFRTPLEAVVLAGLPLSSSAALWGGSPGAMWPALLALPVWVAAASRGRRAWARAGLGAWPTIGLYVAAVFASTLIVLLEQHRIGSSMLAANLAAALGAWFGAWSTADPLYPLRSAAVYVVGPLFFVAVRSLWSGEGRPKLFEGLILWGGAGAAAAAIAQVLLGRGLHIDSVPGESALARAAGPLPDPNAFASYLALVAAFGAVVWASRAREGAGGERKRVFIAPVAWGTLIAGGLWVSGSRAAILALLALLAGSAAFKAKGVRGEPGTTPLAFASVVVVLVLAGLVAFSSLGRYGAVPDQSLAHRFLSTFDVGQSTMRLFRGRPVLWQAGATMIMDEPVTGVGAGRYGIELADRLPVELWGVTTAENAHNYYLQAAAETGLVGVAGLVLLLATATGALWGNRRHLRARAALFGSAAWCLTCLAGHPQLIPSLQLFFWGFLGMATAGYRLPRFGPGPISLCVLLALLVGRVGQETLSASEGPPLYAVGLHGRELSEPGSETIRWTSPHVRLDLRREGRIVELRFFVAHKEFPVTVRSTVGPWREEHQFFEGGWHTLAYYVPPDGSERLEISLDTSPPFAAPDDARDLGVMLAPLRWRRAPPLEPVGAYAVEQEADGRRFRWTAGVACLPLTRGTDVEVGLRADNPDLEADPLSVSLIREGFPTRTVLIRDRAWQSVHLPASDSPADMLCLQTSRTWNPRAAFGSADARNLGVALSIAPADTGESRSDRRP